MSSRKSSQSSYSIPSVSSPNNRSSRSKSKSSSRSGFSKISWDDNSKASRSIGDDLFDAMSWNEAELDSILARSPVASSTPRAKFIGPGRRRAAGAAFTPRSASPKSKSKRLGSKVSPYHKRIPATEPRQLRTTTQRRFSNRTSISPTPIILRNHPSPVVKRSGKQKKIGSKGRRPAVLKILDQYQRMDEETPRKHLLASGRNLRVQKKVFLIPLDDSGNHPTDVGVLVKGHSTDDEAIRVAKSLGWHSHTPIKFLLLKPAFRSKLDKTLGQKVPDALITRASIVTMGRDVKKHTTRSRRDLSFHVFQSLTRRLQ